MKHTVTLTPKFQISQPSAPPPAPHLSISRVLWYKILKWIEQASASALVKATCRLLVAGIIALLMFAPSFAFGYLTAVLQWNNYRIPMFCAALAITFNAKRILRVSRRVARSPRGNQHTYQGVAVADLANFLQDTKAFKREEAIKRLGLTQGQYSKIAQELEEKDILKRGEANARVLRDIGREHLVTQLRDNFPLVWDPERDIWVERDGQFNRWCLSHEFKQRKIEAEIEKKQRKLERIEDRIEEAQEALPSSPLAAVFAHARQ